MILSGQTRQAKRLGTKAADAWTQRVGGYVKLEMLLRQLGAESGTILADADLGDDALDQAEGRIPYVALGRLLVASADRTGCAHLGLLAGRMWRLSDLGAVGARARTCATVGDALRVLTKQQHLDSEGGVTYVSEYRQVVDFGYAIYHPDVYGTDQIFDSVLAGTFNYLRELCGGGWAPSEVLVPHAEPISVAPYRDLFGVRPRFNSAVCAIRFPAFWMSRAIANIEPRHLRDAEVTAETTKLEDPLQQVFRVLRVLLLEGKTSGDEVAQALAIHRRTLNRRLKDHGTTFQCVLDEVRFSVARQLLATSEMCLDDVAASLGYAAVNPFIRTFHRWAGTAPGRWRREARSTFRQGGHGQPSAFARGPAWIEGGERAVRARRNRPLNPGTDRPPVAGL